MSLLRNSHRGIVLATVAYSSRVTTYQSAGDAKPQWPINQVTNQPISPLTEGKVALVSAYLTFTFVTRR